MEQFAGQVTGRRMGTVVEGGLQGRQVIGSKGAVALVSEILRRYGWKNYALVNN